MTNMARPMARNSMPYEPHNPYEVPPDGYSGVRSSESLVPVFIPSLIAVLLNRESAKGEPLTEAEVLAIRDAAVCVMTPIDKVSAVEDVRGYTDIDPENCWDEFLEYKSSSD
jgi:hypothetical protein